MENRPKLKSGRIVPDKLLTSTEAAEVLATTPDVLKTWRYQKRGPRYVKLHRMVRYRASDLMKWISAFELAQEARGE